MAMGSIAHASRGLNPGPNAGFHRPAAGRARQIGEMGPRAPAPTVRVWGEGARDGVDADVISAFRGAATRLNYHEPANERFRIYNDWLAAFCRHDRDRYIGLACLPYGDIDAAVKEIYRVAGLGLRGMELSCSWDMEPMWHPCWEALWKAVNDVKLPLHFHTFPSLPPGRMAAEKR